MTLTISLNTYSWVDFDYQDVRCLILGAIEYANGLGFEPNRAWKHSKYVVEADKPFENKFTYGKDGKPPVDQPLRLQPAKPQAALRSRVSSSLTSDQIFRPVLSTSRYTASMRRAASSTTFAGVIPMSSPQP